MLGTLQFIHGLLVLVQVLGGLHQQPHPVHRLMCRVLFFLIVISSLLVHHHTFTRTHGLPAVLAPDMEILSVPLQPHPLV